MIALAFVVLLPGCQKSNETAVPAADDSVLGKVIHFNAAGGSEGYRVAGWSKAEADFTWTEGTSAKLSLPLAKGSGPLALKITMAALVREPDLPFQPVEVYANGQKIADWQVGENAQFAATIPAEITKDGGTVMIELRTPKAISPKALGTSADTRVLGVCVRTVEVAKSG